MSISSEITRISQNVSDSLTAVASKGATVPNGANSDDLPDLISSLPSTNTVTYNLTGGASASVTPAKAITGQGLSLKLTAPTGYNLNNVTVTMGGVDITSQVFTPDEAGGGGGTPAISVVDTTDSHGGTVRTITALDISDTTTIASDVAQGKYFYTAQGVKTAGTGSGGSPSATQHTIYFEFSDSTNATITAYWDDSFISNSITATTPTTYGGKTVTLAQLDNVTWYEVSDDIPLNTELVDYTKVMTGYAINNSGVIENTGQSWDAISDYIPIDPSMTFAFKTNRWYNVGFYNASKNMVRVVSGSDIESSSSGDTSTGTLNASNIPSTAAYIILAGKSYSLQTTMSLIRTA